MAIRTVLMAGLIFGLTGCAALAQDKGGNSMRIIKNGSQKSIEGPADWFTGHARIEVLFNGDAPSRVTGAIVTFDPGARTNWHSHPLGQTLIVTSGRGWTQCEGGARTEINAGDIIWCPPGHKHWHGATDATAMTHIVIQEALDGTNVIWMEPVSDADYLGTKTHAGGKK